jgi:hypothetical protein
MWRAIPTIHRPGPEIAIRGQDRVQALETAETLDDVDTQAGALKCLWTWNASAIELSTCRCHSLGGK